MLFPAVMNPHAQMFGQLGLAAPTNGLGITPVFKCTSSKCYSTDGRGTSAGTHLLFLNLQRVTNRYAGEAGFKRVAVDGFVGESTRAVVAKAISWGINALNRRIMALSGWEATTAGPRLSTARAMLTSATVFTPNMVALAGGAQHVYDALKYAADALGLETAAGTAPPVPTTYDDDDDQAPAPDPVPQVPSSFPFDPYTTSASPGFFQKKNVAWYIAGAVLLIGLGTATYLVYKG
jgi:hypothetical protein